MSMILIDTSIMVDLLRGKKEAKDWIDGIKVGNRAISFITVGELICGCRNKSELKKVEREIEGYTLIYLDDKDCRYAIDSYKQHRLSHGVGFLDCLIAATACCRGIKLATLNERHYKPFAGITLIRPYSQ